MTDTMLPSTTSPVAVLEAATEAVRDLGELLWAARRPDELLGSARAVERLRSVLDSVQLRVVAEIAATNAAVTEGWATTRDFLTATAGGRAGEGRRLQALAAAVAGGDFAATGRALAAGALSRTQAEVIVAAVERLPGNPALREAAEDLLVGEARTRNATELEKVGRYLVERLDPEGAERRAERELEREERVAHHNRFLSISEDGLGGVRVKGSGTVEDAAMLKAVLAPLAAPQPAGQPGECGGTPSRAATSCGVADCAHDGRDPRDHGTRLWDALIEAARLLAGTEVLPTSHGARPRVSVTISLDDLTDYLAHDADDTSSDDAGSAAAATDTGTDRRADAGTERRADTATERRADAVKSDSESRETRVAQHTDSAPAQRVDAADEPDGAGRPDRVDGAVATDEAERAETAGRREGKRRPFAAEASPGGGPGGTGLLESGESLSAGAVRRLACDADILPVVLGTRSHLLDVGRTRRLVTLGLWTALVVRDQHCAFPACTRPPIACDAHHIRHWVDGGRTSLENLVMLCRTHHTLIHNTPWQVRLDRDDRRPDFLPPPWLDPEQRPLRRRPLRL